MAKTNHSIFRRAYEKFVLNTVARFIRNDPQAIRYMLGFAIKKETASFYNDVFIRQYRHIDAACDLAVKSGLNRDKKEVILDIGGGNGHTAMLFSKRFPETDILIFEPVRHNIRNIERAMMSNPHFKLYPQALGSRNSTEKIFIGRNSHTSSFFEMESDTKSDLFADAIEVTDTETVEVVRLDDVFPSDLRVSIMKMDIQGSELEAMKGGEGVLKRTSIVLLEVNNHEHYKGAPKYNEIDSYLRGRGFDLYDILPSTYDQGKLKEWDVIYTRNQAP